MKYKELKPGDILIRTDTVEQLFLLSIDKTTIMPSYQKIVFIRFEFGIDWRYAHPDAELSSGWQVFRDGKLISDM